MADKNRNQLIMAALEAMPNMVLVDRGGSVIYMNRVYADLLGKDLKDIIGKDVEDVIPGTRMREILQTGKAEIGDIMTLHDHRQDKDVRRVCNRLPLFEDGEIIGAAAVTTFESDSDLERLYTEIEKIKRENRRYRETIEHLQSDPLGRVIGSSPAMRELKAAIREFAASNLTVLLTGETGVGKEVFAAAIHELSPRRLNNYVKINCAAIPRDLLESELFGYEEGAFTGARKSGKAGRFELADKGTLLLDEIGEMPLDLQAKLLRVLQEKEVERLGGTRPRKVDVRVICSTNVNIKEMVRNGDFREDLYYRINTLELAIPPLRERQEDIPALCYHFLRKFNIENNSRTAGIADDVIEILQSYSWPGNVRELEHVVERLAFKNPETIITAEDCGFLIKRIKDGQTAAAAGLAAQAKAPETLAHGQGFTQEKAGQKNPSGSLSLQRDEAEHDAILAALKAAGGNRSEAARILGISRSLLYNKMKKYKITLKYYAE